MTLQRKLNDNDNIRCSSSRKCLTFQASRFFFSSRGINILFIEMVQRSSNIYSRSSRPIKYYKMLVSPPLCGFSFLLCKWNRMTTSPSAFFMYCMFRHGTGGLRQKQSNHINNNNNINNIITKRKKVLHRISEFLQIFTRQIQALVYLWLEKPNIARVMHSQSFCVPLLYFQGSLGNWYVYFYFFCFFEFCPCYR